MFSSTLQEPLGRKNRNGGLETESTRKLVGEKHDLKSKLGGAKKAGESKSWTSICEKNRDVKRNCGRN